MKHFLPVNTTVAVRLEKLMKSGGKRLFSERMSSRLVKCASVLPEGGHLGWQMILPKKGAVQMALFGSSSLCESDLGWIAEKTAKTARTPKQPKLPDGADLLYEIRLPIAEGGSAATVGFTAETRESGGFCKWPLSYSAQFAEWVEALRQTGAVFRAVTGPALEEEQALCRKNTLATFPPSQIDVNSYIGRPVKARFLLLLPSPPSVRLKSVFEEAFSGARLRYLGKLSGRKAARLWDVPLEGAAVLPDYAVRILLSEPELEEAVTGIEVCEEEAKRLPVTHKSPSLKGAVTIGRAQDVTGVRRKISVGELDLRRHYQIVGQTGCGKSTLLTSLILSAIEQGHGLTFFDPHGSTIDTLLRCIPEKFAHRVRVVRIGDADNPVPLNIWDSDDPEKEERTINDLCELFADIFDPRKEGIVGPRYERWLATFARASIAFLGRRASLESIAVLSQSKDSMKKAADAIAREYPDLYATIKNEYGLDNSSDFTATLSWYLCKFQRICGVEQLRKTLGAGANALDFNRSIDTDTVTLVDLASPTIGTHAARIVGTLMLMKLWNAAVLRKERGRTHLVVVDEASLFQTNPMPRMLAEGRKFGVAMVLCHQHTGQLTPEIREALEANAANFSAFRLSARDAATAAIRFDDPGMQVTLARLDAFRAITTLSVDGKQTRPFTLETVRPKQQKNAEQLAADIERDSIEKLVTPYARYKALTPSEIRYMLDHPDRFRKGEKLAPDDAAPAADLSEPSAFVREWQKYRDSHRKAG